jgi:hypothetical protein
MISLSARTLSRSLHSALPRVSATGSAGLAVANGNTSAGPSNNFLKCRTYANATTPTKAEVTAGPAISQTNSEYIITENAATR